MTVSWLPKDREPCEGRICDVATIRVAWQGEFLRTENSRDISDFLLLKEA
jgi:hypothetical protein